MGMSHQISLTVITGNKEDEIEEFLDSFKGAFDELCIVRAIGGKEPDKTMTKAHQWCRDNGKNIVAGDYKNGDEAEEWDHLDDFAAARNMAAGLANSRWLLWADTDDRLADPESMAAQVRGCLSEHGNGYRLFAFRYRTDAVNQIWKIRLYRHDAAKWTAPIHEDLRPVDLMEKRLSVGSVTYNHLFKPDGQPNRERNRRILKRTIGDAGHLEYYLHKDFYLERKHDEARKHGHRALQYDIGVPFSYEICLNLASISQGEEKRSWLFKAIETDPSRREAFVELCLSSMVTGRHGDALAYAIIFNAIEYRWKEGQHPFNLNLPLYGWHGAQVLAQALRCNGDTARALKVEQDTIDRTLKDGGAPVTVLHRTSGNPGLSAQIRRHAYYAARNPGAVQYVFEIDEADERCRQELRAYHCQPTQDGGNRAGVFAVDDSWRPTDGWDAEKPPESLLTTDLAIAVILPTCRPEKAAESLLLWKERQTTQRVKYICVCDDNHPQEQLDRLAEISDTFEAREFEFGYTGKLNRAGELAAFGADIIVEAHDDIIPPYAWDFQILHAADWSVETVLRVNHMGARNESLCVPMIFNRQRYLRYGWVSHPDFTHMFTDDWFTWLAERDEVIIDRQHIVFDHHHPAFGRGSAPDETLIENYSQKRMDDGRTIFERLKLEYSNDTTTDSG